MVGREARRGWHRHPNTINRRLGVAMPFCTDMCVYCAGFFFGGGGVLFWFFFFTVLFLMPLPEFGEVPTLDQLTDNEVTFKDQI